MPPVASTTAPAVIRHGRPPSWRAMPLAPLTTPSASVVSFERGVVVEDADAAAVGLSAHAPHVLGALQAAAQGPAVGRRPGTDSPTGPAARCRSHDVARTRNIQSESVSPPAATSRSRIDSSRRGPARDQPQVVAARGGRSARAAVTLVHQGDSAVALRRGDRRPGRRRAATDDQHIGGLLVCVTEDRSWPTSSRTPSSASRVRRRSSNPLVAAAAREGQIDAPVQGDPPAGEHHHAVREQDRLVDVVGDVQHRHVPAGPQFVQQPVHLEPGQRVERAERLVEQEEVGLADQGAGQRDPLCLTA